ncbi:MAG: hypothetical protein JXR78_11170 [Victivallales bacterium]|nr:hypothetical protein [Victivallales bacterium]
MYLKMPFYGVPIATAAAHCIETLEIAVRKYGTPKIFNSDQGSQFTSREFVRVRKNNGKPFTGFIKF